MDKRLKEKGRQFLKIDRYAILAVVFIAMSAILIHRLYLLQVVNGEDYRNNFTIQTTRTRTIKSTRGNIYDRNGNVLASNELSYTLTIQDSGTYDNQRLKNLSLNAEAYKISQILTENGDSLSNDFKVIVNEHGEYEYTVTGTQLNRFKADVFGEAKFENLDEDKKNASADEMISFLQSEERFAIIRSRKKPYTEEELKKAGLPFELTKQDILNIIYVRYQLFLTSYRKYVPVTIATNLSGESVAALTEQKDTLIGTEIQEDTKRVYDNPEAFASIIGYIGKVSQEDLAELQAENSSYNSESIVGKSGIEKIEEQVLQGSNGQETVYVDSLGKVLKVDTDSKINPTAGGNVYLTIDKNLQIATYHLLEQRIAGVLSSVIVNSDVSNDDLNDTELVRIGIKDVYNALIENAVISVEHFTADDASESERTIAAEFTAKQNQVFAEIKNELTSSTPTPYNELSKEMKEYESYIVNDFLTSETGILNSTAIDKTDATYLAWTRDEVISLKEYLTYAASKNWIDVSRFATDDTTYLDSNEIYTELSAYIEESLSANDAFSKILYKYLIESDQVTGRLLINVLYDQDVLHKNDDDYEAFQSGALNNYDLIIGKINSLELTPAMLALDPCSGSVVITNPNNGEILACVTYPGYDNNRLTNTMDVAYYNKLAEDLSRPFYNKATQQKFAPGSTFKLVTTTAGLEERVIGRDTVFNCNGTFDLTETPLRCWYKEGHGDLTIVGAIQESCNVFFSNVAYKLGQNEEEQWSDSLSLSKLQQYAQLYNLDKPSGIEIPEADPEVSDQFAIQSSIGQGTHSYTTTQLARYVTSLANSGTSYNISLIDKETDSAGNVTKDDSPSIESQINISADTWNIIHEGMRGVITEKPEFSDFEIPVAGKTGTAQESKSRPSHSNFICYAPYENPEIAMVVRIGNGYSSTNAVLTAKDILSYYFKTVDTSELITGQARTASNVTEQVD